MSSSSFIRPEGTDGKAILGSDKNTQFNKLEKKRIKQVRL